MGLTQVRIYVNQCASQAQLSDELLITPTRTGQLARFPGNTNSCWHVSKKEVPLNKVIGKMREYASR